MKPTLQFSQPHPPHSGRTILCSVPSGPQAPRQPHLWERAPQGPTEPPTTTLPLPRAFLRMLFPEKLDVDKKGRPSTAGSKIKVDLARGTWAWGWLGLFLRLFQCLSLPQPRPSASVSGTSSSRDFFQLWG